MPTGDLESRFKHWLVEHGGAVLRVARADWWLGAVVLSFVVAVIVGVFAYVFWLNQLALRRHLEPRRQELQTLLQGLADEPQSPDQWSE